MTVHMDDQYRAILDSISDGVYLCDSERRISYWNPGAERITGYSEEEVTGSSCADGILVHIDEEGNSLCGAGCPLTSTLTEGTAGESQVYLHHKNGYRVPVLVRTSPLRGPEGEIEGAVEVFSDNSALLSALDRLEELRKEAETDPLTGVGNRRSMELKLEASVTERRRLAASAGVLFIDVDRFKDVNDTYGHEIGDEVLKMVARTLGHNLRTSDDLARWGGDEFLILLRNVDANHFTAVAKKLRMLVAGSYLNANGARLHVTVSIGGTLLRSTDTRATLVARADRLLYSSKESGRNRFTWEP
jgi:diguanylate cyclase (GGDEF)-like protein/PAS domain S-box-containing protein